MAQATTAIRTIRKDVAFNWEGMDKKGQRIKGRSVAQNEQALKADLRRQGVVATRIKKQSQAFKTGGKVKAEDIAIFSRQLATMLGAGIPLVQAFEIIGTGHDKPAMQKLVLDIKADVEGGTSLHEALAKHPLYFDDLFVNLVEAGEQAGALEGAARQDRYLQGKERGDQEEGQEGAVLSGRGAGGRRHRDRDPADFRHSAVRGAVQGLRRRSAGVHPDGHQSFEIRAAQRRLSRRSSSAARSGRSSISTSARARCASSSIACR